jgi:thymidylate kinase
MKSLNYKCLFLIQHSFVSIEGNIGSGKTTLLKLLREKYKEVIKFVNFKDWICGGTSWGMVMY